MKQVLKWSIPVDDHDHPIGGGFVVHVGCQDGITNVVQVWTEETPHTTGMTRRARVYGTGQPIPEDDVHIGSAIADPFVWHLYGSAAR